MGVRRSGRETLALPLMACRTYSARVLAPSEVSTSRRMPSDLVCLVLLTVTPIFLRLTLRATVLMMEESVTPSSVGRSIVTADVQGARLRSSAIFLGGGEGEPVEAGFFRPFE